MKLVFDNLMYRKVVMLLVLVQIISVTNAQSGIFTISSSNGCDIDGQPVLWDGENVDIVCTVDITNAYQVVMTKAASPLRPAQSLFFRHTLLTNGTITIQGDFTGRVINAVNNPADVSFTVTSFSSATDSANYLCAATSNAGFNRKPVNLAGRIFTKPSNTSIPITTKVGGITVTDGGTIAKSSDAIITLETSSVSGSPVPTLSITRDGNKTTCSQTSLTSTTRTCQATVSVSDLQSTPKITASASLCDVSNSMTFTSGGSRLTSHPCFTILLCALIQIFTCSL